MTDQAKEALRVVVQRWIKDHPAEYAKIVFDAIAEELARSHPPGALNGLPTPLQAVWDHHDREMWKGWPKGGDQC